MWEVDVYENGEVHVLPLFDLKLHLNSLACKCKPLIKDEIIVHNSFDGREFFEENDNLVSIKNKN